MGRPVCTPWPKSSRLMVTVTVPSRSMRTNADGCWVGLRPSDAWAQLTSGKAPRANPETAAIFRKLRRCRPAMAVSSLSARISCNRPLGNSAKVGAKCMVRLLSSQVRRGVFDGGAYPRIGAAAADVAGHGGVDVGVTGLAIGLEQRGGAHDLAALAIAALDDV